ncbi:MAG: hypothetical protein J07HX64_01896 [halophilic archaeon J07HX64]|jgi:hypothetical protein|nr:MAG: hypothetical protein J07HX64_01896 [halophilic archaeon J07HX64]
MECHYCDADADVAVEKGGVRVGVCEEHFREQMEELAESEFLEEIEDQLNVDRPD